MIKILNGLWFIIYYPVNKNLVNVLLLNINSTLSQMGECSLVVELAQRGYVTNVVTPSSSEIKSSLRLALLADFRAEAANKAKQAR